MVTLYRAYSKETKHKLDSWQINLTTSEIKSCWNKRHRPAVPHCALSDFLPVSRPPHPSLFHPSRRLVSAAPRSADETGQVWLIQTHWVGVPSQPGRTCCQVGAGWIGEERHLPWTPSEPCTPLLTFCTANTHTRTRAHACFFFFFLCTSSPSEWVTSSHLFPIHTLARTFFACFSSVPCVRAVRRLIGSSGWLCVLPLIAT